MAEPSKNVLPDEFRNLPPNAFFHTFLGSNNPSIAPQEWMNEDQFIHDISFLNGSIKMDSLMNWLILHIALISVMG